MSAGRNEPCPCGSGKKHKRCCGSLPEQHKREAEAWEQMRQRAAAIPPETRRAQGRRGRLAIEAAILLAGLP